MEIVKTVPRVTEAEGRLMQGIEGWDRMVSPTGPGASLSNIEV